MISSPSCLSQSRFQSLLLFVLQHKLSSSNSSCLLLTPMHWMLWVHHRWKPQTGRSEKNVCFNTCRLLLKTSSELWKLQKTCTNLGISVVRQKTLLALKEDLKRCIRLLRQIGTTVSARTAKLWHQQGMELQLRPIKKEKIKLWLASLTPWAQLLKS